MTPLWTAEEAQAATGGTGPAGWAAWSVSADSRTIAPGALFVALSDRRDGHDFVADALARGAAAAMVARRPPDVAPDAPLLIVPDVMAGLRALAAAARARSRARVIGVTGSVGKTGTKEMLRLALGAQGVVHASARSFNNHWGVPLTLAALPREADFAVIEMGMNHAGEIAPLSRLARPHVALITTVAPVHLENFRDINGIARAKAEIMQGLEAGGAAVLNRDIATYPILRRAARAAGARVIRFGSAGRPELLLRAVHVEDGVTAVSARAFGRPVLFKLGAPGRHLAPNALGALGAVVAAGGDLARAALALAGWRAPEGRGARLVVALGPEGADEAVTLIDESYNANPASMGAALEVLAAARPRDGIGRVAHGRRIAILGDMLELGPRELELHAALAGHPALAAIDRVHCAGPRMQALHAALPQRLRGEWHPDSAALAARIGRLVDAGDVVMVKGSLGARMGVVVDALKRLGRVLPGAAATAEV
ncbi:MAG: UDP-N-acetylmuramoyl-tripeptide--D-alanyl-D-alanine ligase [Alphaproteobacteria bacterium]|nr:MAG: UDP-N-acetylmuramoyl-tripeptide--D-alanyl-D-alanine ligase [Alphaproteobacteria bacterium]